MPLSFESTLHQFQYSQKNMPMYNGMLYQSVYQFISLSVGLAIVNFDNDWAHQIHIELSFRVIIE